VRVDTAIQLWEDGQRRLRAADPDLRPLLERVADRIVDELRKRLGGSFTTDDLNDLYSAGTDWCLDVAIAAAPDDPRAWDAQLLGDAAFARYMREAKDYAGGRRREPDELDVEVPPGF
jgi:DNA-binding transcriptional LysR family regulator